MPFLGVSSHTELKLTPPAMSQACSVLDFGTEEGLKPRLDPKALGTRTRVAQGQVAGTGGGRREPEALA